MDKNNVADPEYWFCLKKVIGGKLRDMLDSDNKFVLAVLTPFFLIGIMVHQYQVGKWRRKTRAEDAARLANMPKWEDRPADAKFIGWCYNTNRYI